MPGFRIHDSTVCTGLSRTAEKMDKTAVLGCRNFLSATFVCSESPGLEDGLTALLAYTLGVKKLIVAVNKRDSTEENDLGNPNWVVVKDAVLT